MIKNYKYGISNKTLQSHNAAKVVNNEDISFVMSK